jgi:hypothetical protein
MRSGDIASEGSLTPIPLPSDFNIAGQVQGDILYFNGTNWVRLAPGTADQSLRTKGAAANPAWENVNNATNLSISGETTGDLIYYNGANWVRLAGGTSGDVLTANGAGVAPTYQAASAGAVSFVGKAESTSSDSSGTVSISNDSLYKVYWSAQPKGAGTSNQVILTISATGLGSSSSFVKVDNWGGIGVNWNGTAGCLTYSAIGDGEHCRGVIDIDTHFKASNQAIFWQNQSTAGTSYSHTSAGSFTKASAITTANMSITVTRGGGSAANYVNMYVYEYATS